MGPFLVLGTIEPPIGGVSRYCRGLCALLREAGLSTVQIDLLGRSGAGDDGAFIHWVLRRIVGEQALTLCRVLRQSRPEVIIDNHQLLWRSAVYAAKARRVTRVPYVLVIHDGAFPDFVRGLDPRRRNQLAVTFAHLAGVACMSDPIIEAVDGLAPAVPLARLSPLLSESLSNEIAADDPVAALFRNRRAVIVTSGGVDRLYGLEEVLSAFAALRAREMDVGLALLLGSFTHDDATASAIRRAEERFGSEWFVVLTDHPRGSAVIARSSCYVRSSRVDSFGLGLHEAMLAGVPVVASEHPTRPPGVRLYPPGDAQGLAAALEEALRPEARTAARALIPRVRGVLEQNRRATLEFLRRAASPAPPEHVQAAR